MGYIALLCVELGQADAKQQKQFAGDLKKKGWERIEDMQYSWTCEFDDEAGRDEVRETTEDDVSEAAAKSQITEYQAAAQFSQADVTLFYDDGA